MLSFLVPFLFDFIFYNLVLVNSKIINKDRQEQQRDLNLLQEIVIQVQDCLE